MENVWSSKRNKNRKVLPNRSKLLLVSRLSSHKRTRLLDQFLSRNQMEPRAPSLPRMKLQKQMWKLSRTKTRPKHKTRPKIKPLAKIKMLLRMQPRHPKMWFITWSQKVSVDQKLSTRLNMKKLWKIMLKPTELHLCKNKNWTKTFLVKVWSETVNQWQFQQLNQNLKSNIRNLLLIQLQVLLI